MSCRDHFAPPRRQWTGHTLVGLHPLPRERDSSLVNQTEDLRSRLHLSSFLVHLPVGLSKHSTTLPSLSTTPANPRVDVSESTVEPEAPGSLILTGRRCRARSPEGTPTVHESLTYGKADHRREDHVVPRPYEVRGTLPADRIRAGSRHRNPVHTVTQDVCGSLSRPPWPSL